MNNFVQKQIPVKVLLHSILEDAFSDAQTKELRPLMDESCADIDKRLFQSEKAMLLHWEKLCTFRRHDDGIKYIDRLPTDERFFLYHCVNIAWYFPNAKGETISLYPMETLEPRLYQYIQERYNAFKRHCRLVRKSLALELADLALGKESAKNT